MSFLQQKAFFFFLGSSPGIDCSHVKVRFALGSRLVQHQPNNFEVLRFKMIHSNLID